MRWYGKLIGAILGWMLMRHPAGAILGAALGHAIDAGWFSPRPRRAPPPAPEEDYRILGIADDASDEDIERAYRRLMAQYHPDRVAGAADEFRELAERRSRDINAAYDRVRTRRRNASKHAS